MIYMKKLQLFYFNFCWYEMLWFS